MLPNKGKDFMDWRDMWDKKSKEEPDVAERVKNKVIERRIQASLNRFNGNREDLEKTLRGIQWRINVARLMSRNDTESLVKAWKLFMDGYCDKGGFDHVMQ